MPRAGDLRDRAVFERFTAAYGDYGEATGTWATLTTVWADVLETPGREALQAGRLEATKTATMRVRRSATTAGIAEGDRVTCRGVTWNIVSLPSEVGRKRDRLEFKIMTGDAST